MKILRFLLLFAALPAFAQQAQFTAPDCEFAFRYSVVGGAITSTTSLSAQRLPLSSGGGNVVGYDNREKTCTSWNLMYQAEGVSGLSVELDSAPSSAGIPGSWTVWPASSVALGAALPLTNTASGSVTTYSYLPWVSVNLNSASGTGQVWGRVLGWRPAPGQDSVTGATITNQNSAGNDPCQTNTVAKSSAVIAISGVATTQIVPLSASKVIYVCGFWGVTGGTTPTVLWQSGTGSNCGTGTANLSGTPIVASSMNAAYSPGMTAFKTPAAAALCIAQTGTSPTFNGVLTYVQQ